NASRSIKRPPSQGRPFSFLSRAGWERRVGSHLARLPDVTSLVREQDGVGAIQGPPHRAELGPHLDALQVEPSRLANALTETALQRVESFERGGRIEVRRGNKRLPCSGLPPGRWFHEPEKPAFQETKREGA